MLIGMNLLYLIPGEVGGTEVYATRLLREFATAPGGNRFVVFMNDAGRKLSLPETDVIQRVVCPVNARSRAARYWYEQVRFPRLVKEYGVELLHSAGYVGPIMCPCPHVITLHDANFIALGTMPAFRRLFLGAMSTAATHACDHVITVSEFSRLEAIRYLRLSTSKVTAIHSAAGVDGSFSRERPLNAPDRYVLALSSQSRHKNLNALIRAFGGVKERVPHTLVIAGHPPRDAEFARLVANGSEDGRIVVTGYLNDATLRKYMSGADLFVFPSLYEGFGMPAIEAQVAGTPLACSDRAALPEVAGRGAAYFDPESEASIGQAILRVLESEDTTKALVAMGHENAQRFSWARTAKETFSIYRKVVDGAAR